MPLGYKMRIVSTRLLSTSLIWDAEPMERQKLLMFGERRTGFEYS
jgi:hypothetical protein